MLSQGPASAIRPNANPAAQNATFTGYAASPIQCAEGDNQATWSGLIEPHSLDVRVTEDSQPTTENDLRSGPGVVPPGAPEPGARSPRDVDAMTGVVGDPSKSLEFFGNSSAGSFLRQINSAIDARLGPPTRVPRIALEEVSPSQDGRTTPRKDDFADRLHFILPQRTVADDLLNAYYDLLWAVFPIHDRIAFDDAYQAIWLGSSASPTLIPERMLYCMMNVIFALGTQFSEAVEPSQRRQSGQVFWKRALKFFGPNSNSGASLEGVQCLLLMGLFSQSTRESYQCWMTIGAAIRMAQSLGLHVSSSARGPRSAREVQMARRVWHGCVFLDR